MVEGKVLRRAVFLDRDGTLNKDVGYVHRKEDWQWLPGVAEALKRLREIFEMNGLSGESLFQ